MTKLAFPAVALALALACPLVASEYYAAPAGTPSGAGTRERPWDLSTALAQPSAVQPGDTIWLRGGTYKGHFISTLRGASGKPIVVRQYGGERATLDGNDGSNAVTLLINGSDAWFWGFEITNSNTTRVSTNASQVPGRGEGVNLLGARTRLINVVIHDTSQGVLTTTDIADTEVNGCLIYYNGYDGTDRGHGHGIYIQNAAPSTKKVTDNVIFGQFGIGIHAYTESGKLDGLDFEGNTSFDNGVLSTVSGVTTDILIGASGSAAANATDSAKVAKNTILRSNYTYFSGSGGTGANLGYSKGIASPTIVDNYLVGGSSLALVNAFRPITMTGNSFFGTVSGFQSSEFPSNTYLAARPAGVKVFVRPNQYEPGRANITVYNWDKAPVVDANVSAVLKPGWLYEVRSAQNFFGAPVLTGTYNGAPIHIPMTGLVPSTPIGRPAPPSTGPDFQVFVLLPKAPPPAPRLSVVRPSDSQRTPVTLERAGSPPLSSGSRVEYFPGAARSDVVVTNRGESPSTVTLRFLEHDRDNTSAPSKSFVLGPHETLRADDAVASVFGLRETDGLLEVEADGSPGISVLDRALSAPGAKRSPGGSLGAISNDDIATGSTILAIRPDAAGDLVLFNPGAGGAAVSVTLVPPPETASATTFVFVPPRGYVRRPLAALFPSLPIGADDLSVAVDAGMLPVYASVIDSASRDSALARNEH